MRSRRKRVGVQQCRNWNRDRNVAKMNEKIRSCFRASWKCFDCLNLVIRNHHNTGDDRGRGRLGVIRESLLFRNLRKYYVIFMSIKESLNV